MKVYKLGNHSSLFRDVNNKISSITLLGYLKAYYLSINKIISICNWREFRNYYFINDFYGELYMQWLDTNFRKDYRPHIKRKILKYGYELDNIDWFSKKNITLKSKEIYEIVKKVNIEKWDKIKSNPKLLKYYRWNATLKLYKLTR